ncbi:MAG: NgoPII family restriction endonuclease [Treponemataceae bacterium]|nr:NgoPII family restriction endonuclease [Treponemataceae bacterium]
MNNIISAILNLVRNPKINLIRAGDSRNRANNMGEALEEYIKDLFAGTVEETDPNMRNAALSATFSYLGNQNNPPDSMLHGGDAIEVKKIENKDSALALNSSYPKAKLYADSPMISKACRECENWTEKDMIYAVGVVSGNKLTSLAFVYGEDYCASKETYENIKSTIKTGVESIRTVEFAESKELGRVNHVDPLGITYLRIRGMWGIENPFTVFNYICKQDTSNAFNFMCIINNDKFNSFENAPNLYDFADKHKNLSISDVRIKDPNNPARLKEAKLITFFVEAEK